MTPLTVAAYLARMEMFFHIANIEREVYWQIGASLTIPNFYFIPDLFLLYFSSCSSNFSTIKIVDFSGNQTWIVGSEGEH